ncbi:MAG: hypothetical protein ACXAAQ_15260 [Candidatus Thorarchaeota archaeon]|jgi:hypothetical protein
MQVLTFIIGAIMIFSLVNPTLANSNLLGSTPENHSITEFSTKGLLPDPNFNSEPDIQVVGESGEFTSSFLAAADESESSVELVWSHTANTVLDYVGPDPEWIMPAYNDFIYTYQEFDWSYDQRPNDAYVNLTYSVVRSGDFAEGVLHGNNLMFRVFVWVIDSSANWVLVHESRDATYFEEYEERRLDFDYFTLRDIFDGMIEVNGTQDDPEDSAVLVIGLAPNRYFYSWSDTEPWTYYNGMVKLGIQRAEFYVTMDFPADSFEISVPMLVTATAMIVIVGIVAAIVLNRRRVYLSI